MLLYASRGEAIASTLHLRNRAPELGGLVLRPPPLAWGRACVSDRLAVDRAGGGHPGRGVGPRPSKHPLLRMLDILRRQTLKLHLCIPSRSCTCNDYASAGFCPRYMSFPWMMLGCRLGISAAYVQVALKGLPLMAPRAQKHGCFNNYVGKTSSALPHLHLAVQPHVRNWASGSHQ